MAIEFRQTDPSDPLKRKVWRNMSAADPRQMIEKLIEALRAARPTPEDETDG